MVVIEAVSEETAEVIVVSGAGWEDCNGLYLATGRTWHGAPVLENDARVLLSREPHKNQKTGETSYGWILGQNRKPLYAVQTDSLTPPGQGWRKFGGAMPLPKLQVAADPSEGANLAALEFKQEGNDHFAAKRYAEAEATWSRGLALCAPGGPGFGDGGLELEVALLANRAELRLRQERWGSALCDAEAVLAKSPGHAKALMRAAVAARELGDVHKALDLAQQCQDHHPRNQEARQLCYALRKMVESENKAVAQRGKMRSGDHCLAATTEDGHADETIPRAFDAKDRNSQKGFKAFRGYGAERKPEAPPPLSSLPYHHMGVPHEQVELMDKFFQEMREKKALAEAKEKEQWTKYEQAKAECKSRSQEQAIEKPSSAGAGDASGAGQPSAASKSSVVAGSAANGKKVKRAEHHALPTPVRSVLSRDDKDEVDTLFAQLKPKAKPAHAPNEAQSAACAAEVDWRERLEQARAFVDMRGDDTPRRATMSALRRLRLRRRGEPSRFEQASTEVYCWWDVPSGVTGKDVNIEALRGGSWLRVTIKGVEVFNRKLFAAIHGADLVWTLADGELSLTLAKAEKNKLWEHLGEEVLLEPMSGAERLAMFKNMVSGDDGNYQSFDELDPTQKQMVEAMKRYQHAMATGDNKQLALAEADLEEYGRVVV